MEANRVFSDALWLRARALWFCAVIAWCMLPLSAAPAEPEWEAMEQKARHHWSFQSVQRPELPSVRDANWLRNPVDRFILAQLETQGLSPAPPCSRETFIRRVTFDLIGLPPTPEDVDAFAKDTSDKAEERLIERLLSSPHYGERWGRHWLDLVRFAESDGYEHDAVRPHAWRYRDYVIRSFNADKPYDRFIREQVAGDELFPGDTEALVATSFNLLGPDMVDSADQVQRRLNTLNDMTDTTGLAFLGLTVGCARCHDHKFEPVSQKDYFRLQAFYTPAEFRLDASVATPEERADFDAAQKVYDREAGPVQRQIDALEGPTRERLYEEKLSALSEEAQAAHRTPKSQRTDVQSALVIETAGQVTVSPEELKAALSKDTRRQIEALRAEVKRIPKPKPLPLSPALQARPAGKETPKTFVLFRGDYNSPREEVGPGLPLVLASAIPGQEGGDETSPRRAALARWLTSTDNPLTARVMANRIWQHHFGRGIVSSPSQFGLQGEPPSHPELLDWLASEFMHSGWSIKAMHRLILASATYRQSGEASAAAVAADPHNRWCGRWERQRLEGEVVRDSLLALGGLLNTTMGGPGVFPPIPADMFQGAVGWTASRDRADHYRRSIYIFARRNLRYPFLEVFDAPDSNLSCSERGRSTTAPQSLTLLNAEEVMHASATAAARVHAQAGTKPEQVVAAYRLILGRGPNTEETLLALNFLERSPLSELCRALFNLNAFVYVD